MKILYIKSILLLIFFFTCTNPFSVRTPEKPPENTSSDLFEQPTTYETVLINLYYAVIQKNLSNYKKCFIDPNNSSNFTFRFLPDTRIEQGLFSNWTLADEFNYFEKMTADNEIKSINLTNFGLNEDNFNPITNFRDSVQTDIFDYELSLSFPDTVLTFRGQAKMKLVKNDNSLWAIYYWEDRPAKDNFLNSWSQLKLLY